VRIPGLPIRAANGKANMGDLVAEVSAEPFFGSEIGVVADQYGKPGVVAGNTTEGVWRNWDGSKWVVNSALIGANVPSPTFGNLSSDNTMVLTMQRSAKFLHTDVFQRRAFGYDLNGYKGYVSVDEYGLRTTGGVYGVGIDETAKTESVLRTTVTPAPLPCTWMSKDIAASGGPGYAGMSGFANRTFVVTNYGVVLDNTNDSFHYTYGKFTGDGTIVARVNANAPSSNARAGVMMRETLNPNSKHAMMTIGPVKGAYFGFRNSTGGSTSNFNTSGITTPYWVKLTRKGSTFTGSISSDGITWKEAGKSSISMSSTIHVGLASASYHRYGMQTVKFERVSAPGCQP